MVHRVRELPATERPRERLVAHGSAALSASELLAVLWGAGSRDAATEALTRIGPLADLARADPLELTDLRGVGAARAAQLVASRRGQAGGYTIARPADEIAVADIIRAVEGPLADVHGTSPERLKFTPPATPLRDVWMATRAALRDVLEVTTLADIVSGDLPDSVTRELTRPGADHRR